VALGLEERTSLGWLALLRIAVGALFLQAGWAKLREGFDGQALSVQLAQWQADGRTFGFYREQLEALVLPHLSLVAVAVTGAELAAGGSLVLGLGSRVGAFVGLALNVNYYCASGQAINLVAGLVNLAVLVGAGGRALGLDGFIKNRRPRYLLG
jgi:uncharacterized membrane protein YphA (DoxX/SURF4 family)